MPNEAEHKILRECENPLGYMNPNSIEEKDMDDSKVGGWVDYAHALVPLSPARGAQGAVIHYRPPRAPRRDVARGRHSVGLLVGRWPGNVISQ